MTFFESLLALLAAAVVLLQVARRLSVPYPAMLAGAGVVVAAIPGVAAVPIEPATALALFLAPVIVDAAFDYPIGAARKLMEPLVVFAVVAVLLTALVTAVIGQAMLGLPFAAALALGAVVAPSDAAAATAVLANMPVARRVDAVLKGESLFNDATALLLFSAATSAIAAGGIDAWHGAELALAAPGGIAFGWLMGRFARFVTPRLGMTVGATLFQFVYAYLTWIIAEHLHLSAVLATVASAMTIAASVSTRDPPRARVHSYAVWTTAVFVLNVLAFLLMGLQARRIVTAMSGPELVQALWFSAAVVGGLVATRMVVAFGYRWWVIRRLRPQGRAPELRPAETLLLGWTGMRGLVTLATAFALPVATPQRDTLVLAAFAVVLVTLVVQGGTLAPLIRWTGTARDGDAAREIVEARLALAEAALARLEGEPGGDAADLRHGWGLFRAQQEDHRALDHRRGLAVACVLAARDRLDALRGEGRVGPEAYLQLQEELDWKQLSVSDDDQRRIVEA